MKKILALALALCLLSGVAAFADVTVNGGSSNTVVTYTISNDESFLVTIPASLNLSMEYGQPAGDLSVTLSAPNFNVADRKISVALTTAAFELSNDANKIPYTIKDGDTVINVGDVVLNWTSGGGTTTAEKTLKIKGTVSNGLAAGTYQDTLTFTVSVEDLTGEFDGEWVTF